MSRELRTGRMLRKFRSAVMLPRLQEHIERYAMLQQLVEDIKRGKFKRNWEVVGTRDASRISAFERR